MYTLSQAKYVPLKRQNEKLQMEVMQTRVWQAQSVEEELEEDVDSSMHWLSSFFVFFLVFFIFLFFLFYFVFLFALVVSRLDIYLFFFFWMKKTAEK